MGKQTLEQRVNAGVARRHFWFGTDARTGDVYIHCSRCGGSLLVDYIMFGHTAMSRRLASFMAKHDACVPQEPMQSVSLEKVKIKGDQSL